MSVRRIIARNAFWTAAGMACGVVTGFLTAPFLVHRLGQTNYGIWILIASLTSYLNLVDLGLRSTTRHVAFLRARNDHDGVNELLSTAQSILAGAGTLTVGTTLVLLLFFTRLFDVSPDQAEGARTALLLAGVTVAVTLGMSIYDAALYGYERFDVINWIEIPVDLAQTASIFYLIGRGGSLVTLASIILVGTVCAEIAKAVACYRMDRRLRINPLRASASAMHRLFGYGLWRFVWSMGTRAASQCAPLVVSPLGKTSVTQYSIAARLIGYGRAFGTVGTGVLTPTATGLHAVEKHGAQRTLFVEGGKFCLALSLFIVTLIVFLAKPFVILWMGAALAASAGLAATLALGELLPMSQWITYSILLGRDRHRVIACASVIDTLAVVGFGLLAVKTSGLEAACVVVAISGTLCRGVLPIVYGCRVLEVSLFEYARRALAPPIVAVAAPAACLALLAYRHAPITWPQLVLYGAIFGVGCAATYSMLIGYPSIYRKFVFPAHCVLRRRSTKRWYERATREQWLDSEQIDAIQRQKLTALVRHCAAHVPYYRDLLRDKGVSAEDVSDIAVLRDAGIRIGKPEIRAAGDAMIAETSANVRLYKIATSGSTGTPAIFRRSMDTECRRQALKFRAEDWIGKSMGTRTTIIWGRLPPPHLYIRLGRWLFWRYQNYQFLSAFDIGPEQLVRYIDRMTRFRTEFIESYVTAVHQMAKVMAVKKIAPPPTLKGILVGAEQLVEEQRQEIEASFGCPVYNRYGSSEFKNIASECAERRGLHINADHLLVEVVDENDRPVVDQVGEIVITDLENYDMPLIRYSIGDRGILSSEKCSCGRSLPLLKTIDGRVSDRLITRSGREIHDMFFVHNLSRVAGLSKFRAVQTSLDLVRVDLELDGSVTPEATAGAVRERLDSLAQHGIEVDLNFVSSVPLTKAGKLRHFVSEITTDAERAI